MWLNLLVLATGSVAAQLLKRPLCLKHTLTVTFLACSFMVLQLLVLAVVFEVPPRSMRGNPLPLEAGTRGLTVTFAIIAGLFLVSISAERLEARRQARRAGAISDRSQN